MTVKQFAANSSALATELGLADVKPVEQLDQDSGIFERESGQLTLHLEIDGKPDQLKFSLIDGEVATRANKVSKSNEVIAKAIGCKSHYRPRVIDATAGMGRDSLIMAKLGCCVSMHERNVAIFTLLRDALVQLKRQPQFDLHLDLVELDSINALSDAKDVDVIYLDPMFPERKKSALVKKEMRLFKRLAGEDTDSDQLLLSALKSQASRVVVKRPKGAPLLANKKPSHEIKAKKFRYDVYLNLKLFI
jgi:16S rRNA (guanine1516-N2)-methyltransferase